MHRSRLYGIFIDTPTDEAAASVAFWSATMGSPGRAVAGEEHFTVLSGALPAVVMAVQAVDDAPRYHVDIETDDVEAEVARLENLGAHEISRWLDCHAPRWPASTPPAPRHALLPAPRA